MSLYHELKRRNVFRVAIAYLALAWLLIEVAGTLFPGFGIPIWAFRFVVIVLALGFIPTLIFSWAYEITPEGVKREEDVVRDASITHITAKRLDWITIGIIAAAVVFILVDRNWLSPRLHKQSPTAAEAVTDQTSNDSVASGQPELSIAVLPFVNMSDDPSNEYFSDGISEELINVLLKVKGLRVVSRTSSFAFKGKGIGIPEIAKELNVNHVLEGSVRKSGNRVRITAQLIDVNSDAHLWSETYDRELEDIFAIQEEISYRIVQNLEIVLEAGVNEISGLAQNSTLSLFQQQPESMEAYEYYLQGRHLNRQDTHESWPKAQALFQQALSIDPNYAAAWAGLALNYSMQAGHALIPNDEGYPMAREASMRALTLAPDNAQAYAILGRVAGLYEGDLKEAANNLERALVLEPSNPDVLNRAAALARDLGRSDEAIVIAQRAINLDPINPESHYALCQSYLWAGYLDEAIASCDAALTLSPEYINAHYRIGIAMILKGEPEAALAEMQQADVEKRLEGEAIVYYALGKQEQSDIALAELIDKYSDSWAYNIAYVQAFRGESDKAFEWLNRALKYFDIGLAQMVNQPEFANIHNDPRWLRFLENIGKSPEQLAAIEFDVKLPE